MASDYLRKRRNGWYLKLPIPRAIRHLYPTESGREREHVEESLHTTDKRVADQAKWPRILLHRADFKRKARDETARTPDAMREAQEWREALRAGDDEERDAMESVIADRAEDLARGAPDARSDEDGDIDTAGPAYQRSKRWYDLATTKTPTLREAWDEWSRHNQHNAATKLKDEQAFRGLMQHLATHDALPAVVTNAVAREYVKWLNTEARSARGGPLAAATKSARIAPLRIFWAEYLEHNEHVTGNPWRNHKFTGRGQSKKRAYTEAELLTLFNGPELAQRGDVAYSKRIMMQVYALGFFIGARLGEICNRTLGDVTKIRGGYSMRIPESKTDAGIRTLPILHPIPVAILRALIGKRTDPSAQLFAEFIPGGPMRSLGWYVGKAMGRYRDKVGLPEEVDTHSTRRQLITELVAKGHPITLVQFYVGHEPQGVTAGIYAQATDEGLRAIAKAIKYPAKVERAMLKALDLPAK